MTPIRVGLMGLGRIGRNLFRILYKRSDIQIVAISDIADHDSLEYLLRFDTLLGRFPDEVRIVDGHLYVVGKQIPILSGAGPSDVNWRDLGVDYVVEATGRHRTQADFDQYLESGARRVVLCAPPADPPDLTVVMGVNHDLLTPEHRIVSNASCTAHCVAPVISILHEAFGVSKAFLTTVHAYTNQDRLADVPSADPRRGRAAAENIIPQQTSSAEVLMGLIPKLRGHVTAMAMNVPVPDGSVVDLVCWHDRPVTVTAINEVVRTAAAANWQGILDYEDEPIVSSDILRTSYSSTFDSLATMVLGDKVSKTLAWYDNGFGYANRVVDLIQTFCVDGQRGGMMAIRVGINGFGRIGRSVFRILSDRDDIEVVAINDLFDNDQLAYLLKYDTVMGTFRKDLRVDGESMFCDGDRVAMTDQRDPAEIPWKKLDVDVVVEATGVFRTRAALEKHLDAGARKVLLTVPAKDEIDATIVIGVNDHELSPEHRIVSNASCTTNCLAPIAKILDDAFGIEEGFVTTIHAYTNDQRLADVPHKDPRRSRAAAVNIIPTTTGAARAAGKVLPRLKGKLDGMAIRVPVPDGSVVDLVVRLAKRASRDEINAAVRDAAAGDMKRIVEYSEEALVSSDIIGNSHSSIFDALSTRADGDEYAKIVSWYDNEWGYSMRIVDLIGMVGR